MKHICFDIDDCLNFLTYNWLNYYKLYNECDIECEQLVENPPHKILEISKKEYLEFLNEFRFDSYENLIPNIEILNWFEKCGDKAYFSVLTSVPRKYASISAEWVLRYFGNWIQSINFIYSKRENDNSIRYFSNKGEWINWFGKVDFFIDDSEKNLQEATMLNPDLICYCPKCPWNSGEDIEVILEKLKWEIQKEV